MTRLRWRAEYDRERDRDYARLEIDGVYVGSAIRYRDRYRWWHAGLAMGQPSGLDGRRFARRCDAKRAVEVAADGRVFS